MLGFFLILDSLIYNLVTFLINVLDSNYLLLTINRYNRLVLTKTYHARGDLTFLNPIDEKR